jgi:SAM-dependent methyltransferase
VFPQPETAVRYYFSDGAESAQKLSTVIREHLKIKSPSGRYSLLEFASGYGMVTRHLRNALGGADRVSCDIHQQAIDFIRDQLGEAATLSQHVPEDLALGRTFDVVFALSFFSHVPEATFGRWLQALFAAVSPGGILVFTTHGLASLPNFGNPEIPESGFWFVPNSEQGDLDRDEYGSSLTTPDYVIAELFRSVGAPLAAFKSAYWWGHQDLYVLPRAEAPSI